MDNLFLNLDSFLVQSPNVGMNLKESFEFDNDFVELLDLTKDLELVDSQSEGLKAEIDTMLLSQKLVPRSMSGLVTDEFLTQHSSKSSHEQEPVIGVELIGRESLVPLGTGVSEISVASPHGSVHLGKVDNLNQLAQLRNVDNVHEAGRLKPESVAQWASSLAAGDINSVKLEQRQTPRHKGTFSAEAMDTQSWVIGKDKSAVENVTKMEQTPRVQPNAINELGVSEVSKKLSSQRSADFLLDKTSDHKPANSSVATAALTGGTVLNLTAIEGGGAGQAPAINDQAVDWVADRVDHLRQMGGGVLKLELNPKNLGAIEIEVAIENGRMQVHLKADKQSTLSSLTATKADLLARLQGVADADLTLSSGDSLTGRVSPAGTAAFATSKGGLSGSQEFIDLGQLSKNNSARFVHQNNVSEKAAVNSTSMLRESSSQTLEGGLRLDASSHKTELSGNASADGHGDRKGSGSDAWQRDQRREQARQGWEEYLERKSA